MAYYNLGELSTNDINGAFGSGSSFGGVPYNMFGNQQNLDQLYQIPQAQVAPAVDAARQASQLADPFAPERGQYKTQLSALMKNPGEFGSSPAYQFAFDQGLQGVNRSLAKGGMLNSGNRLQELTKYGQGMAGQQYFNQAGLLSRLAGAYSGSPAASGQMLMGGFGNAQELERMAAGNRAAVQNPQPYRPNDPNSTQNIGKRMLEDMARREAETAAGRSGGASYSPSGGGGYSGGGGFGAPMQQSYGGDYSFGQPGTFDGPGVGYGTQGGTQTDANGNVIFGQGTGGDIPTYESDRVGPYGQQPGQSFDEWWQNQLANGNTNTDPSLFYAGIDWGV